MKNSIILAVVVAFVVAASSCKETGTASDSSLSGSMNEVLVVMDKAWWSGEVGDSVRAVFSREQSGLPQPEPVLDVIHLPLAAFEKNVKGYRNVLLVRIGSGVDSTAIRYRESAWAKTQKYFEIQAPDAPHFLDLFSREGRRISDVFVQAERERLVQVYEKEANPGVMRLFERVHLHLACPPDYIINKDTTGFAWISRETNTDGRGIIFFERAYEGESQLTFASVVATVNAVLKEHIPGPLAGTYMALDTVVPTVVTPYNREGAYCVEMRGLWEVVNDFMGGPYVLDAIVDTAHGRVAYVMGYVYAPENKKRNRLQRVEAILNTVKLLDRTEVVQ